jgi:hypothetical protein
MASSLFKIKNVTEGTITICGMELAYNEFYEIQLDELTLWGNDTALIQNILDGNLEPYIGNLKLSKLTACAYISNSFPSSLAVDKNNRSVAITGNDWQVITADRIIWDTNDNYDIETDDFVIPFDGLYFMDIQVNMEDITNVTAIEVALFKRGEVDDYWFILDKKMVHSETEIQITGCTLFDLYEDDRYTVKIKLYGDTPSATINGSDDLTAWGYSFQRTLYGV